MRCKARRQNFVVHAYFDSMHFSRQVIYDSVPCKNSIVYIRTGLDTATGIGCISWPPISASSSL